MIIPALTAFTNIYTNVLKMIYYPVNLHRITNCLPNALAKNLGISTITVENAYAQLIAEGYIYSLPKKGYYVTDIAAVGQPVFAASYSHSQPENTNFLSAAHTSLTFSKQPDADTSYQIDFSTNHASGANFPFYTWAKLMKEVMSDCSSELLTPSPAAGILELREAIARHLSDFRGMKVLPEQIIVGAGTEYLYGLLIQLFGSNKSASGSFRRK